MGPSLLVPSDWRTRQKYPNKRTKSLQRGEWAVRIQVWPLEIEGFTIPTKHAACCMAKAAFFLSRTRTRKGEVPRNALLRRREYDQLR